MIETESFFNFLTKNNVNFFTGVPDSLLKEICQCIQEKTNKDQHIISSNEGNAIAIASGYYLSSKKIPLVYMQNSGFGNAINPLISLASKSVYSIPMLVFVGWRGEPNIKDEPQHMLQGEIMINLLKSCKLKYNIFSQDINTAKEQIINAIDGFSKDPEPFIFLIKKNTFSKYKKTETPENNYKVLRREAIELISNQLSDDDILLGATGKISREIYQYRKNIYHSSKMDFLNVGAMGHLSQIALSVANNNPGRRVVCFDGDGSILMHLGGLAILGSRKPKNLKHFIINNGCHESVGGQPTVGFEINIIDVAKNLGYEHSELLLTKNDILSNVHDILNNDKLSLIDVRVGVENEKDLIRPDNNFLEHKNRFINHNINYLKREFIDNNSFSKLEEILNYYNAKNIFIFTGKQSFIINFKKKFKNIESKYNTTFFNNFSSNFDIDTLKVAIEAFKEKKYDIIIAIGGGSVIDIAKMVRIFSNDFITINSLLDKKIDKNIFNEQKLIAIPTTSGSGSENTKFSVLYKDNKKFSIEHESMLPDHVILDHDLKYNVDKKNAIASGLDVLCQSIESLWSINSNDESKSYAIYSLKLCLKYLEKSINEESNFKAKEKISLASFYAGKAINISKTTISHAISYPLTKYYELPHGMSVALTIIELLKYNLSHKNISNLQDNRGKEYYENIIKIFFKVFDVKSYEGICIKLEKIFKSIGLYEYFPGEIDINLVTKDMNQSRLKNNPLKMDNSTISKIILKSINYEQQ